MVNTRKWLVFIVLMALLSSTTVAQDTPLSDYILALSPDGTQMLVASYPSTEAAHADQHVALMDMNGQASYHIFLGRYIGSATWSPDGAMIAILSLNIAGDGYNLHMLNPASGEADPIAEDLHFSSYVRWSPDGHWIVLISSGTVSLWERATGEMTILIESRISYGVKWSPNSQFIMFTGREFRSYEAIFLYDTHEKQRLCDNLLESYGFPFGAVSSAAWSPDGTAIAMLTLNAVGDPTIYLIDADCTILKSLVYTNGQILSLDWSADGTSIYYLFEPIDLLTGDTIPSEPPRGLYQASIADGTISPVWIGEMGNIRFAPDHQHFVIFADYHAEMQYASGIGDTATGMVFPIELNYWLSQGHFWSADSQQFVTSSCTPSEHDYDVYRFDVRTHEMVVVTRDGPSAAPDCGGIG